MRRGARQAVLIALALLEVECVREARTPAVHDAAGLLAADAEARLDAQLALTLRETGVDLRLALVDLDARSSLEDVSAMATGLGRGAAYPPTSNGGLLLFDAGRERLRLEVGYALEAALPDAWVGELIHDHARFLFDADELETALLLSVRMLRDRLRVFALRGGLAPTAPERFRSGGGGASDATPVGTAVLQPFPASAERPATPDLPAESVEAVYERYVAWLARGRFETDLAFFTPGTRSFLGDWPMTPGYLEHVLAREEGRTFEVVASGDLAILYCRDDPTLAPHFFVRGERGWMLDLVAEAREIQNIAGGPFAWAFRNPRSPTLARFADVMVSMGGFWRLRDGDNRPAPAY